MEKELATRLSRELSTPLSFAPHFGIGVRRCSSVGGCAGAWRPISRALVKVESTDYDYDMGMANEDCGDFPLDPTEMDWSAIAGGGTDNASNPPTPKIANNNNNYRCFKFPAPVENRLPNFSKDQVEVDGDSARVHTCTPEERHRVPSSWHVQQVRLHRVNPKVVFAVHEAFSKEECELILGKVQTRGDKEDPDTEQEDSQLKDRLLDVLRPTLPTVHKGCSLTGFSRPRSFTISEGSRVPPHFSQSSLPEGLALQQESSGKSLESFFTVCIHLSEGHQGGSIRFLQNWKESKSDTVVQLPAGSLVVYQHNLLCSRDEVTKGTLHSVELEVLYTRENT